MTKRLKQDRQDATVDDGTLTAADEALMGRVVARIGRRAAVEMEEVEDAEGGWMAPVRRYERLEGDRI